MSNDLTKTMRGSVTVHFVTLSLLCVITKAAWQQDSDLASYMTTESLTELFGLSPNRTGTETKDDMNAATDLGHQVEEFIQKLLSFVSENAFANEKFDAAAEVLGEQLVRFADVRNFDSESSSEEIWQKLTFAKYAFQIMVESSEIMKRYDYLGRPEEHLINFMTGLRVRLLVFFDENGLPNVKDKTFRFKTKHYADLTSFLVQTFDELANVPIGTRLAFKTQTKKVRDMVRELEPNLTN